MDIINDSIGSVYKDGIATKILQHMDRIRNVSDVGQARRWVMELLQNSRDCSYDDRDIKVKIEFDNDKLKFSHNGKPFKVRDILSIINQVSSKTGDANTVGQFGTGFMSTYQLSSIVQLRSVLKENNLPYKSFDISLDRSGTDRDTILQGIARTMDDLRKVDDSSDIADFNPDDYNTEFIYHLGGDYYRNIALVGMEDLKETILYVLLFSRKIREVRLIFNDGSTVRNVCYVTGDDEIRKGGLGLLSIEETRWEGDTDTPVNKAFDIYKVSYMKDGSLTLAAALDEKEDYHTMSEKLPRLFVDFPLIGAEEFPFPVVINCRDFKVNEPRSGITLVDNENSNDAKENKEIMLKAVDLYREFLNSALENGFGGLENIVFIPAWKEDKEASEEWVREHLYETLYGIASEIPMIESNGEKYALSDSGFCLPYPTVPEEKESLSVLLSNMKGIRVPSGEEKWLWAFSNYPGAADKARSLAELAEKTEEIIDSELDEERTTVLDWLQKLYNASMSNEDLKTGILAGKIKIFPTQKEGEDTTSLLDINEVYEDPGIPEVFKDTADLLDGLKSSEALRIREKLLHPDFKTEKGSIRPYPVLNLSDYIYKRANRGFTVEGYKYYSATYLHIWHSAWKLLISCGPDEKIYDLMARTVDEMPEYKTVSMEGIQDSMWRSCYCSFLEELSSDIERTYNIDGIRDKYASLADSGELYDWLNEYFDCVSRYLSYFNRSVYPDQNGKLEYLTDLRKDDIENEVLKSILAAFSDIDENNDIYNMLLDRKIINTHQFIPSYSESEIAQRIGNVISSILSKGSLSEAPEHHQEACSKLLSFIRQNPDKAPSYFPSFYNEEDQMKLLTPGAAVKLQREADDFRVLMEILEEEDVEEVKKKLKRWKQLEDVEETDSSRLYYDPDSDVYFGDDLYGCDNDFLREIGTAGEKYAYREIRDLLTDMGYISEEANENICRMHMMDGDKKTELELIYADHDDYHQPGYDIMVKMQPENGNEMIHYFEVKTHTPQSIRRGMINLSNTQMKLAARYPYNYNVMEVVYDHRSKQGKSVSCFHNPMYLMGNGTLVSRMNSFQFSTSSKGGDLSEVFKRTNLTE